MIGLQAIAQTDSIVMTINGKAVTRSEFEYAYQKIIRMVGILK